MRAEMLKRWPPTHEEIVCIWYITTHAKQLHQIVKLAVDVAAYLTCFQSAKAPPLSAGSMRTVTGASTPTTLPSSISSSLAL